MARNNRSKRWIQKAIKRPGAFREKAQQAGMSTEEYARTVIARRRRDPSSVDDRTYRQAGLALTLKNMKRKRK